MARQASNARHATPAGTVGTAEQAASLQANATVNAFIVSDTAADIAANFDALNADTKLTGITVTDGLSIPLSYTQFITGTAALALLPAGTTFTLSAIPEADAATIQANAAVIAFSLTDTAANLLASHLTFSSSTAMIA